ncbi:MAG TPA: DNA polymerase III subunit beta [Gammaproteobacteria bacterium]|nr:DNA polymerase III subunit beta [Gammaproteobacteria bacterium]
MKITINRELLLNPLQVVNSVIERRQALPILNNFLMVADKDRVTLSATDMEVEVVSHIKNPVQIQGAITIPARKFIDICKALPMETEIHLEVKDNRAQVRSGRSRFALSVLSATDYPTLGGIQPYLKFKLPAVTLRGLIGDTQFAMAHQDVRYYLNGMLMEFSEQRIRTVATDGHRLALSEAVHMTGAKETVQIIVPRKGIIELWHMLSEQEEDAEIQVSQNHIRVIIQQQEITTKLVDGKFPDYMRVIPAKGDKVVVADREALRQGLARTSILSNEKFRGVRLTLKKGVIQALAHNPDQEEAEEDIEVEYEGQEMEIGFNVVYLLDALSAIKSEKAQIEFSSPEKSCLIYAKGDETSRYVIMPMRL